MTVRTWVGRFTVNDGRVEEEGPWLGSLIRQRADDEADELYMLIEAASAESAEYTAQLVDVIARLYQRDALSLTGALTRALKAAHEHLRDWNAKSLREHQVGAGASCLALRGTDAYLAQAGPSLAYVRTADGGLRRIAADPPDFGSAVGVADPFEPKLTRITLQPGDLVLLASTALDVIAPAEHIGRMLSRGADDALPELYLLCRDQQRFSLVLLSCFEQAESPPEYLTHRGGTVADAANAAQSAIAADAGADTPADPAPVGAAAAAPAEGAQAALATGGFDLPRRPIAEQVREITESTAPPPATGLRIRGEGASPRYKRTTGAGVVPHLRVPRLFVFGAITLAVLGLIAWWQLPGSVKQNREDRFTTLIAGARDADARAQATSDPGTKRQLLTTAQTKLMDAAKIHPDNGELTAIKGDVTSGLATLDAVHAIDNFAPIADLSQQVTGALSITRAVVGGDNAYFLDAKGHRVIRLALDGRSPPETILHDGALAGFVTASRPVDMAWSGDAGGLYVLDDRRQAFVYLPGKGVLPLTVRGTDGWGSDDAITASGGNLYVLDVKDNQVWRYLPGQGGFDSERTGLLDQTDLRYATEVAVGQDLYVLDAKAGVRRFVGKTETPFSFGGIDTPLVSPAALTVLPGSNRLVVADRGNKRVVIASADGQFLRQIVSPQFTDLRSVAVDEGKSIIYVLNGDTLMKAPFPP